MLRLASRETENALARSRETSIILGRRSAQERVASFILAIWDRLGADSRGEGWIDLPMSRGEIADSLGLTIETVSRQFSELRDLGLIETEGRSALRVIDLPGLFRALSLNPSRRLGLETGRLTEGAPAEHGRALLDLSWTYLRERDLPEVDPLLLKFMREECDFDVEHADGSFLDHLYFLDRGPLTLGL